ncbi:hypothetical protein [Marinicella litoralis]|uniref:Uncharacterized protein n=1 Tax=Marinicella litoralis TaxID=644220 RepID=A0A4R6XM51_9GAMM|nr:hypothetical protein [Marinicella litoralis]TDR18363.1 hypothetical protein C8D91_2280 [Marinicella litoralis]
MSYLNNHLLSFFGLVSGIMLMMICPQWLTYMILPLLGMISLVYAWHTFPDKMKLVFQFCTEFMGFCLMLGLFVTFIIGLGSIFS